MSQRNFVFNNKAPKVFESNATGSSKPCSSKNRCQQDSSELGATFAGLGRWPCDRPNAKIHDLLDGRVPTPVKNWILRWYVSDILTWVWLPLSPKKTVDKSQVQGPTRCNSQVCTVGRPKLWIRDSDWKGESWNTEVWRSSLFCLEFVFSRVCSLVKTSEHSWLIFLSRMENLCWISTLWFIFLLDSSYILKSPRPRKPSPSPMGPVGRGRDRWGWCSLRVFMGFVLRFTSWWGRRDVKRSIKQTIIPHCVHGFLLDILGHYGIQTI